MSSWWIWFCFLQIFPLKAQNSTGDKTNLSSGITIGGNMTNGLLLSTGAIVGIAIGCLVFVIVVTIIIILYLKRRSERDKNEPFTDVLRLGKLDNSQIIAGSSSMIGKRASRGMSRNSIETSVMFPESEDEEKRVSTLVPNVNIVVTNSGRRTSTSLKGKRNRSNSDGDMFQSSSEDDDESDQESSTGNRSSETSNSSSEQNVVEDSPVLPNVDLDSSALSENPTIVHYESEGAVETDNQQSDGLANFDENPTISLTPRTSLSPITGSNRKKRTSKVLDQLGNQSSGKKGSKTSKPKKKSHVEEITSDVSDTNE